MPGHLVVAGPGAAGLEHVEVVRERGCERVAVLLQQRLQAAQGRRLLGLGVEVEQRRSHRAEQDLAARPIAASVGHGLIGRVELVEGGRELAGVVEAHGRGVVLAGLGGQGLRRRRESEEQGEEEVHRNHGRRGAARRLKT